MYSISGDLVWWHYRTLGVYHLYRYVTTHRSSHSYIHTYIHTYTLKHWPMSITVSVYNTHFKSKKCSIIWCWIMSMYFCRKHNLSWTDTLNKSIKINFPACTIGGQFVSKPGLKFLVSLSNLDVYIQTLTILHNTVKVIRLFNDKILLFGCSYVYNLVWLIDMNNMNTCNASEEK